MRKTFSMSGQQAYPPGIRPHHNPGVYSGSGPPGPGQNFGWPPGTEKGAQHPLQNGTSGDMAGSHPSFRSGEQTGQPGVISGGHPSGIFPPTGAGQPRHQVPGTGSSLTSQFNNMTVSEHSKVGVRTVAPGGMSGEAQSMLPTAAQINGPPHARGVSTNITSGSSSATSNHTMPQAENISAGTPVNMFHPSSGGGHYVAGVPGVGGPKPSTSSAAGIHPHPAMGAPQTHSLTASPPQPSSHTGQPPLSSLPKQLPHLPSTMENQHPSGLQGQTSSFSGHHPPHPGSIYPAGAPPPQRHQAQIAPSNPAGHSHQPPPSFTFGVPSQDMQQQQQHLGHSAHLLQSGVPPVKGHQPSPPSTPLSAHGPPPHAQQVAHTGPSTHLLQSGDPPVKGHFHQPPPPHSAYAPPPHGQQAHTGPPTHHSQTIDPSSYKEQINHPSASSSHPHPAQNQTAAQQYGHPSTVSSNQVQQVPTSAYSMPAYTGGPPILPGQGQTYQPSPGPQYGMPPQAGQTHIGRPPLAQSQMPTVPVGPPPVYGVSPQTVTAPPTGIQPPLPPGQGQLPPPPGQGQLPPPPGHTGHFPGSASYSQRPSGHPPQPVQQPQPQKRLDPDQMPSPIQVIEDDRKSRGGGVYQTNARGSVPPLVTTHFTTEDQGNANPRFLRSTIYNVPCTSDLLKSSHIPFALVITPFAELGDQEQPPPIADFGELGPVRCKRCKAYMNPYMQFIDGGRRFQCVFCSAVTDVPNEYFAHLDHTGRRVDCYNRPELCLGSYEFVVNKDYCKNGEFPKEPVFIFMIDVSYNSIRSGLVQLICDKLKSDILVHLPKEAGAEESEIRVGFVTYHRELHFYNVKNSLAQPQMMVVADLEDVFVPTIDGFLVKLSESEAVIDSLLAQIPELFAESKETELVLGPVIQAGLDALRSADRTGRLYIFHTGLPTAEAPGKLKNRDDRKLLGTEKEKTILSPQTSFYNKLGSDCVAAGCSVELFLFPNQYCDVATISDVCRVTAGNLYKYSYFQADTDGERFLEDLKLSLKQSQAFDAILRVRTSTGIRPVDFYGNFYMANTVDVEMASMSSHSTVCLEVKHDDKLSEAEGAYVQVAALYTSMTGQRRLRCLNLSLNCCSQIVDLFRNCELDVLINFYAKQALRTCLKANPKQMRDHIMDEVAQLLACYRKNCANPSSPGQLVLPECMKLLPLYTNCILKSDSLSAGSEISTDDRSYLIFLLNGMSVKATNVLFYPRMLPLHNIDVESSELPVAIRCSAERLEDSGMYILENGLSMFLWVGNNVSSDFVKKVFGATSVSQVDSEKGYVPRLDNPVSRRLCQIINIIREERPRYMKLTIVKQGDKLQPWFDHFLVEDKTQNSGISYVDFLLHIHKEIRNILG